MANAQIGRVESIEGDVTLTPAAGQAIPLLQGMPVYLDDFIRAGADGQVSLRMHDGSTLILNPGHTITLDASVTRADASLVTLADDSLTAVPLTGVSVVSTVAGEVQVLRDGITRPLQAGDTLFPGDIIVTATDGLVTLRMPDGSTTDIGPDTHARLGGSEVSAAEREFLDSGIDDPAEIQAAILAGRDPSQDAPAPGSGENEANEGHTHIRILPSDRAVTPDSGHETNYQPLPVTFVEEELLQDEDSIPEIDVTYVAGGPGVVDEAGLPTGSSANDGTAVTTGSFTIDTGNDQLAAFEVQDKNGNWIDVTTGNVVVQGVNGVLTVTLTNGTYNWSYELTSNLTTHTDTDTQDGDSDRGVDDQQPGDMFAVRVIDDDGDISPPATIDIVVNDDGPSVMQTALQPDALQVDESQLLQDAQLDVSGQFAVVTGADQPASTVYVLSVPGGPGTDSGLVDNATGQRVILSEVNGIIEGRTETSGELVFTLGVDAAGVLTLDQLRALHHPDSTDPDDVLNLATPDQIVLTATVTDADGDMASDVLELGSAISFRDDGPQAVDDIAGTAEDTAITWNVLGNDVAGADDPAVLTTASLASGQGTVSFLPNGDITVTPAAGYEGPIVVDYTIVDSDGDPSSATLTVNVDPDSVPSLTIQDGTVDEAALPDGSNAASPNEAASGGFGLNTGNDGVGSLVINGVDVTNGGTVAGAYGTLTVTLTNGVYSWDYLLNSNAPHPDPTSTGTAEGIEDLFNVVVTDSDGDTASDVLNIAILDDGPSVSGGLLGEFSEGSGPHVIGPVDSVLNVTPGADGLQSITFTNTGGTGGTLEVINGQLVYTPPADVDNGEEGGDSLLENFLVTVTDGDGDMATSEVTFEVLGPILIIGSNSDDDGPDDGIDPHAVNPTPITSGMIVGTAGTDFIAGDTGGTESTDTNANLILVLDTSGSMRSSIDFTDRNGVTTSMSRIEAQKLAVIALLTEMANSNAAEVRVHIVEFNADASAVGTFDLIGGNLQAAIDAVNGLTAGGVTNYEAGLQAAIDWSSMPANLLAGGNVVNQTFFISDGKPNRYLDDNGNPSGSASATTALNEVLGSDGSNEVLILEEQFGPIEAVGIALTGQSGVAILDQVEGEEPNSGAADNIITANELIDTLSDLNPLNTLSQVGEDTIDGGDGNDIIFGDSLYTDTLADNLGLATPPGSGWQVFSDLEATPGWSREDTTDYIRANHAELATESTLDSDGRAAGGDFISGGNGDDIIYGQEGNDEITGGAGNDILSGGSGSDTFIWTQGESGNDEIIDFNTDEGDVLDIGDLLTGITDPTAAELDNTYMSIASGSDTVITVFGNSGNADQIIQLTGFDSTGQSSVQIIENLLTNGNLVTD